MTGDRGAIQLFTAYQVSAAVRHHPRFYPDLCAEIIKYLENVPSGIDVFVSTTSDTKRREIEDHFTGFSRARWKYESSKTAGATSLPKLVAFEMSMTDTI